MGILDGGVGEGDDESKEKVLTAPGLPNIIILRGRVTAGAFPDVAVFGLLEWGTADTAARDELEEGERRTAECWTCREPDAMLGQPALCWIPCNLGIL